jgi:hypothetical protein
MCSGRASCALRRERYQCRVAALTCATVRRRTAAPVSMCVLTPARSRTCPTEPMGTCAPSIRCVGSHERMLASSTEQVGTDMHTHMPSGAPLSRRTGAPSQRHTCAQRGVHAGSMRGLCLAIEAGGILAAEPVVDQLFHQQLDLFSPLPGEDDVHLGERLFGQEEHHRAFSLAVRLPPVLHRSRGNCG